MEITVSLLDIFRTGKTKKENHAKPESAQLFMTFAAIDFGSQTYGALDRHEMQTDIARKLTEFLQSEGLQEVSVGGMLSSKDFVIEVRATGYNVDREFVIEGLKQLSSYPMYICDREDYLTKTKLIVKNRNDPCTGFDFDNEILRQPDGFFQREMMAFGTLYIPETGIMERILSGPPMDFSQETMPHEFANTNLPASQFSL